MKKVLRIELDGVGPYRHPAVLDKRFVWMMRCSHFSPSLCPVPSEEFVYEFKLRFGQEPLFGFSGWDEAREWFWDDDELEALYSLGFRWRWFKPRVVVKLNRQVAFLK